jgi:potassium/chloride transporter 9
MNISSIVVLLGEFATTFFSALMGVIGAAKLLQAIARDAIIPGLSIFCRGAEKEGEPIMAILFTFVVSQLTMLFDINQIASFITMTYLMTFLVTNLACFLLKIGSAPNFRPSFHYFNSWTALAGTIVSGGTMFLVDGIYASGCVCILVVLFLLIHFTTPPKSWGDVSQGLIYHQVRKYLLRLRPEHVKFWRPQILLFVNDFESQHKMIYFCNALKKGALFVLGRVIVTQDFANTVPEIRREQAAWTKFIEYSRVKAFVTVSAAPSAEWGIRNIVLNSGLGGMRPNIVVIGLYRGDQLNHISTELPLSPRLSRGAPPEDGPTKGNRADEGGASGAARDSRLSVQSYLTILEDLLFKLRINVAVARGFEKLELPAPHGRNSKSFIDLWPIQMSAEILTDDPRNTQSLLTTNFDTYTLILQLGCILHTVPLWKKYYRLRVAVFVEYETDVEEERGRVETLLEKLRIEAEVLVFWLASGHLQSYRVIVNGEEAGVDKDVVRHVDSVLQDEEWWQEMKASRHESIKPKERLQRVARLIGRAATQASPSAGGNGRRFDRLRRLMETTKRRKSVGGLGRMSVSFGIKTHRLLDSMVEYHSEGSEESSSEEDETDHEPYMSEDETIPEASSSKLGSSPEPRKTWASRVMLPRGRRSTQSPDADPESAVSNGSDASAGETSPPPPPRPQPPAIKRTHVSHDEPDHSTKSPLKRLRLPRVPSSARFTSSPIPETKVAAEEGTGPSIMFADTGPHQGPAKQPPGGRESIYQRRPASPSASDSDNRTSSPASGYPSQASIPLSFNELPCRAQHLILNELIKKHSEKTAVVFTTLPSPTEGICHDKDASESFVSDLEVLCDGLPPCLLVHSNSMTVTMNL